MIPRPTGPRIENLRRFRRQSAVIARSDVNPDAVCLKRLPGRRIADFNRWLFAPRNNLRNIYEDTVLIVKLFARVPSQKA